jgi:5-methylcytosine-specific restriction endonuclease McrA
VGKFHVDHIMPLAKGGLHCYTNVQVAHPKCNLSKKDKIL